MNSIVSNPSFAFGRFYEKDCAFAFTMLGYRQSYTILYNGLDQTLDLGG